MGMEPTFVVVDLLINNITSADKGMEHGAWSMEHGAWSMGRQGGQLYVSYLISHAYTYPAAERLVCKQSRLQ
ncbi:MAG: hypothetical protein V2I37_08855 [Marinilabiliaceae bacterium]|jgi:hypothetical protein|nr:hypothetical protein [Marinilabiliaceae bacterium]